MTTRALARLHVPCIPHVSPLLLRRASAVPVESQGSRTHTTQPPLQSTTDHHRPMTSFTLPSDHWAPVRTTCLSLFPLNRLRFSGSLHRSPSIQLHLQHDSMVDDQSTPTPRRLQAPCVHHLESTPRHSLVEATQASGLCHVFPRPEVGHHQHHVPMSSSPILPPFSVPTDIQVDPSDYLVRPSRTCPTATTRSRLPNRQP
jgi:hypothetical protein